MVGTHDRADHDVSPRVGAVIGGDVPVDAQIEVRQSSTTAQRNS